jgi:hypothetical protein
MADNLDGLDQFIRTREDVARAFVNGQLAPLLNIVTRASPATFFGPDGDSVQGGIPALSRYERDACLFESGSTDIEVLHTGASGDYAFWVRLPTGKSPAEQEPRNSLVQPAGNGAVPKGGP